MKYQSLGRMGIWLGLALGSMWVVHAVAPHMVKVTLYKLSLLFVAVYVLYWIERGLAEKRPHEYFEEAKRLRDMASQNADSQLGYSYIGEAHAQERMGQDRLMRRTIFIAAGMIAVALGS